MENLIDPNFCITPVLFYSIIGASIIGTTIISCYCYSCKNNKTRIRVRVLSKYKCFIIY